MRLKIAVVVGAIAGVGVIAGSLLLGYKSPCGGAVTAFLATASITYILNPLGRK